MDKRYIYALRNWKDGSVVYVGKTNKPLVRLKTHRFGSYRKFNSRLFDWIKGLKGEVPLMTILRVCEESDWNELERDWIEFFRGQGVDLLNIATGGRGAEVGRIRKHSEATKERLRAARESQLHDASYRERHRNGVRKWAENLSQEEKDHLAEVGRKELAKHRGKGYQSRGTKKYWASLTPEQRKEFCEFRTQRIRERVITQEERKRLSGQGKRAANKFWSSMTPEARAEFIAKRNAAIRENWARMTPEQRNKRLSGLQSQKWGLVGSQEL